MKPSELFLPLILLLSAMPSSAEDIEVTVYVDDSYRPFSYLENGVPRGIYVDILRTAFARMEGFKVALHAVPWERGKYMMEKGEGLALAPVFFHGHDWPYLHPYSVAFSTEIIQAICTEDVLSSPRPTWPDDYTGLTIGNVTGFDGWGGEKFRAMVAEGRIDYEEARGTRSNILKLAENRVDCIMMEQKAFDHALRELMDSGDHTNGMKHLKKGAIIGTDPVYIGYSRPAREKGLYPFQFEFMQAFDSELYRMIKRGEVAEIMNSYTE